MLKANGKIYELGDNIGGMNCRVSDISVLKGAIKGKTVPVVCDFVGDTDKVIGHADLSVVDNAVCADLTLYSEEADLDPDLRLGFFANDVKFGKDDIGEVVKGMSIRSISLSHTGLGGRIENLRKK
jgi:hypothetical protein